MAHRLALMGSRRSIPRSSTRFMLHSRRPNRVCLRSTYADVDLARAILAAYEQGVGQNKGAVGLSHRGHDVMIDAYVGKLTQSHAPASETHTRARWPQLGGLVSNDRFWSHVVRISLNVSSGYARLALCIRLKLRQKCKLIICAHISAARSIDRRMHGTEC